MHDHSLILEKLRSTLPSDGLLGALAEFYKSFADPTRMKILFALLDGELCVCAIAELLGMEQSAISHQLQKLKAAKLLQCRREGKAVLYSLADEHVALLLSVGYAHLTEEVAS